MRIPFLRKTYTRTSISGSIGFGEWCQSVSDKSKKFETFRSARPTMTTLEHVQLQDAQFMFDEIKKNTPELLDSLEKFRESERIGQPITFEFAQFGTFAPTTVRYIKVLSDLIRQFGDLKECSIVEIGGGYGGQCKIILDYFPDVSYTIVDLHGALALSNKFIGSFHKKDIHFVAPENVHELASMEYDLLISNYAFSELSRKMQEEYVKNILVNSKSGYMILNKLRHTKDVYSHKEIANTIPGSSLVREVPLTGKGNKVLIWHAKTGGSSFR